MYRYLDRLKTDRTRLQRLDSAIGDRLKSKTPRAVYQQYSKTPLEMTSQVELAI